VRVFGAHRCAPSTTAMNAAAREDGARGAVNAAAVPGLKSEPGGRFMRITESRFSAKTSRSSDGQGSRAVLWGKELQQSRSIQHFNGAGRVMVHIKEELNQVLHGNRGAARDQG
jgi:hypothetical protein